MTDTYKRFSNILFTFCFHSMRFIDISFVIVLVPFCAARQRCAFSFTKTLFRCARHAPMLHCLQSQSYIFTYILTYYRLYNLCATIADTFNKYSDTFQFTSDDLLHSWTIFDIYFLKIHLHFIFTQFYFYGFASDTFSHCIF